VRVHLEERRWKLRLRKIRCQEGRWMKLTVCGFDIRRTGPPKGAVKLLWLFERYRNALTT
jgi:hypothetical protein